MVHAARETHKLSRGFHAVPNHFTILNRGCAIEADGPAMLLHRLATLSEMHNRRRHCGGPRLSQV